MASPRILSFPIATVTASTHFSVQFSPDRDAWTYLKVAGATDLLVALLSSRKYSLDGVNATDDANNNKAVASTAPMWYRTRLKATTTYGNWGQPFVFPSAEDFTNFAQRRIKDPSIIGKAALLETQDYLDHLISAIKNFEQYHPQLENQTYSMTANTQSYNLPDDWCNDFSYIREVEYPIQAADPKTYLKPDYVEVDEARGQWYFVRIYPSSSETARLIFTSRHARDGSTVPVSHFESVGLYMAGSACEQIMAEKTQFGDVRIGGDFVAIDPRIKRWGELAMSLKGQAMKLWDAGGTSARTRIPHYDDHGAIPAEVWTSPWGYRVPNG